MTLVKQRQRSGYVALISVVVLSLLFVTVLFALSFVGFSGRLNIVRSDTKRQSEALAEACVETALLGLTADSRSVGTVTVGSSTCEIVSIETVDTDTVISVSAEKQGAVTNLRVRVRSDDFSVVSWEEVRKF